MEALLFEFARWVALAIELVVVLILAVASALATWRLARMMTTGDETFAIRKEVWIKFGTSIALALEFTLAADIIRSLIVPTWEAIGQLAAIATIRTLLNIFLMRDIETLGLHGDKQRE